MILEDGPPFSFLLVFMQHNLLYPLGEGKRYFVVKVNQEE